MRILTQVVLAMAVSGSKVIQASVVENQPLKIARSLAKTKTNYSSSYTEDNPTSKKPVDISNDQLEKVMIEFRKNPNDIEGVINIINQNPTFLTTEDDGGWMPIMWILKEGNERLINLILEINPDLLLVRNMKGDTPVRIAAEKNYTNSLELIIKTNPTFLTTKDENGWMPIIWILKGGDERLINLIVVSYPNLLLVRQKYGYTPVSIAAEKNYLNSLELIIQHNSSLLTTQDENGWMPIMWILKKGNERLISLILEKNPDLLLVGNKHGDTSVSVAASHHFTTALELIINQSPTFLTTEDDIGWMPIIWILEKGNERLISLILEKNPDLLQVENKIGRQPISIAAEKNFIKSLEFIIKTKSTLLTIEEKGGWMPIEWILKAGNEKLINLILVTNPDLFQIENINGNTPVSIAAEKNYVKSLELIIKTNSTLLTIEEKGGWMPIMWILKEGNEMLINQILDINPGLFFDNTQNGVNLILVAERRNYRTALKLIEGHEQKITELTEKANKGDADSQYDLAHRYHYGKGVKKNLKEATVWYKKAAGQEHAMAQFNLGGMYFSGLSVAKDYTQAHHWYEKAAEQEHSMAQFNLGDMYYYGLSVSHNYTRAHQWYEKAALLGHLTAQNNLGDMYINGQGVAQDFNKAREWFNKAAKQGLAIAQFNLGMMYYHEKGVSQDFNKALVWLKRAAKQELAIAQYHIGVMYYSGKGVDQDYTKAYKFIKKAAKQDYLTAQNILGVMYYTGNGVAKDLIKARQWLEKAAQKGHSDAQINLERYFDVDSTIQSSSTESQEPQYTVMDLEENKPKTNLKTLFFTLFISIMGFIIVLRKNHQIQGVSRTKENNSTKEEEQATKEKKENKLIANRDKKKAEKQKKKAEEIAEKEKKRAEEIAEKQKQRVARIAEKEKQRAEKIAAEEKQNAEDEYALKQAKVEDYSELLKSVEEIYNERLNFLREKVNEKLESDRRLTAKKIKKGDFITAFQELQRQDPLIEHIKKLQGDLNKDIISIKNNTLGRITANTLSDRETELATLEASQGATAAMGCGSQEPLGHRSPEEKKVETSSSTHIKDKFESVFSNSTIVGSSRLEEKETPPPNAVDNDRGKNTSRLEEKDEEAFSAAGEGDGLEDMVVQVIQDIETYIASPKEDNLGNINLFFNYPNALSSILHKSSGSTLIDFLNGLSNEHNGESTVTIDTYNLIMNQIKAYKIDENHLPGFIGSKPKDIESHFGEDLAKKVEELNSTNEQLALKRHIECLSKLAGNLGIDPNAFHNEGVEVVMITNEHQDEKLESLLNSYQIETLRIGLMFLINSQSAAAEDVIESSSVLALFATARKLFVYDHATKKNIVKLYKKQSLKSQNEITISILNQETLSQQWQDARRQANAIWHGDGKNGLDKNQDNSEKLKDAHTWLLKNAQMFLEFTVLLSSIMTSSKKVDLSGLT